MRLLAVPQRGQSKVVVQAPVECKVYKVGSRERENRVRGVNFRRCRVCGDCGGGGGDGEVEEVVIAGGEILQMQSRSHAATCACCVTVFVVVASRRARAFM